jgi:hypothetical protein
LNNPLMFTDPDGLQVASSGGGQVYKRGNRFAIFTGEGSVPTGFRPVRKTIETTTTIKGVMYHLTVRPNGWEVGDRVDNATFAPPAVPAPAPQGDSRVRDLLGGFNRGLPWSIKPAGSNTSTNGNSEPLKFGYGVTGGGSGAYGLTGGVAGTGNAFAGYFYDSSRKQQFVSGAGVEIGVQAHPPLGNSPLVTVGYPTPENTPITFGKSLGAGAGFFVTNSGSPEGLRGPFFTRQLNTPVFSAQLGTSGDGTTIFSLTYGPSTGGSYWQGTTQTFVTPSLPPPVPVTPFYRPRVREQF